MNYKLATEIDLKAIRFDDKTNTLHLQQNN